MADTVLTINRFDSHCNACGRGADPMETHHTTVLQYAPDPPPGCGARFIAVTSDYLGMREACTAMRPDLPWVGEGAEVDGED
jgi:hypothetical protein